MDDLKALPIACTLSPGDLRERLELIQTLTRDSLRAHDRDDLNLTLHYAADANDRVRDMVAGERHCCAFLRFEVRNNESGVHVTIRAPEHAREAADELFAQFIAEAPANQ
ncbi:MAG: hypothetical protein ACRD2I_00575 [Vicinamibacterales bacterium]